MVLVNLLFTEFNKMLLYKAQPFVYNFFANQDSRKEILICYQRKSKNFDKKAA